MSKVSTKSQQIKQGYVEGVISRRSAYLMTVNWYFPLCTLELVLAFSKAVLARYDVDGRDTAVVLPEGETQCPVLLPYLEPELRQWAKKWGFEDAWAWDVMLHTLARWQEQAPAIENVTAKGGRNVPAFDKKAVGCHQMTCELFEEKQRRTAGATFSQEVPIPAKDAPLGLAGLLLAQRGVLQGGKPFMDYNPELETRSEGWRRISNEMKKFKKEDYIAYCEQIEARHRRNNAGGLPVKDKLSVHALWTAIRRVNRWTYERIADWSSRNLSGYEDISATTVRRAVNTFRREAGLDQKGN